MSRVSSVSWALSIALAALLLTRPADAEPPTRVGRVSLVDGTVTVTGPDAGAPDAAPVNYPVSAGMHFATAAGSRAELELGNMTARLDGRTELEIAALDDTTVALRLTSGSVDLRVRILFDGDNVTVDTRDGRIALTQPGAIRVDAAPLTHVAVFTGSVHIHSPHGDDDVFSNESVDINGAAATMRYGQADTTWLDSWAAGREQETVSAVTERYVDPETAGAGDLDQAGTWDDTPDYGPVWYPADVSGDWAPYQFGSWAWVAPWGWTWIDNQPWGFAPFHYGRWLRVGGSWGWWPGERHRHPAYAPAVVGFTGNDVPSRQTRPHGWAPLAPGEPYHPPYPHNDAYVRNINAGTLHIGPSRRTDDLVHGDHDNGRPGTPGFAGRGSAPAAAPSGPPSSLNGERGFERPFRSPDNHGTGDQIIINNDTFRRPRRPDNAASPIPGAASGVTAMPLAIPPPVTPAAPPAPITPMTTPPAGSYGQPTWRNDPRLNNRAPSSSMPSSQPAAPTPIPTPRFEPPVVQPPHIQVPDQPRPTPSFPENPNRGFGQREMPRPLAPAPSTGGPRQPRATGADNSGQGNTGQNGH